MNTYSYIVISKTVGHEGIGVELCCNSLSRSEMESYLNKHISNNELAILPGQNSVATFKMHPVYCKPDTIYCIVVFGA